MLSITDHVRVNFEYCITISTNQKTYFKRSAVYFKDNESRFVLHFRITSGM